MEIVVGNLKIFDIPTGFTRVWRHLHDTKLSVLREVSKHYPGAHVKFCGVYGEWALRSETEKLLSTFFEDFEVVDGKSPVDSSPLNNEPKIMVNNEVVNLATPSLVLLSVDLPEDISQAQRNTVVKVNFPITKEVYLQLKEKYTLIADIETGTPENILEKTLADNFSKGDTLSRILLLKVLRGEKICG